MAQHLTLVDAKHTRNAVIAHAARTAFRWVRNTLVVVGLAFIALFVTFLVTRPHTPAEPTSKTTTWTEPMPEAPYVAPTVETTCTTPVTGSGFFNPCADLSGANIDYRYGTAPGFGPEIGTDGRLMTPTPRDLNGDGKITGDIELGA